MKKIFPAFYFFLFYFLMSQILVGQNQIVDSLLAALPKATADTERIKILGQLSEECDFDDIVKYSKKILALAEKNKVVKAVLSKRIFLREEARAYNNIGVYYFTSSKILDALDYYQKGVLLLENDSIDFELQNSLYNNIAAIEMQIQEYDKALQTLRKCLKTDIRIGSKLYIATDYNNISGLFSSLNQIDSALYYGLKSIEVRESEIKTNPNAPKSLILYHMNVGGIYLSKNNIPLAEKHIGRAYELSVKISDTSSFTSTNYWKAQILMKQKKYTEAMPFLQTALKYANNNHRIQSYSLVYRGLYALSDTLKDYHDAYRYYKLYKAYADSAMNINLRKEAQVKEIKFGFETREISLKSEHEKQMTVETAKQQKQRIIIWFIIGFLALALASGLFIYRGYLQKKKINKELEVKNLLIEQQKELVEEKQRQIVDSINYAKHIQHSILADEKEIKLYIENFFVLYLPKDIVSGDFYWFTHQDAELFFASVDCTGHGVPGAFLSMIGSTLLNEIVNFKKTNNPSVIIENLATGLTNTLANKDKEEIFVDGMDISLCKINTQTRKLCFASANHRAYVVNENGLTQLEPQVKSVHGIFAFDSKKSETTELIPSSGSMVYMATDGYADQVGEESKKKLTSLRLKELLAQAYKLPVEEQKQLLEKTLLDWKGKRKQNDDILLMGFRVP